MAAGATEQGEQTSEVASAIEEMTKTIIENSRNAANASEVSQKTKQLAEEGSKKADVSLKGMLKINEAANTAANEINYVAISSEQQSISAEQISKNIEIINNVINESATGTQQIAREAENLRSLTEQLKELITRFQLNERNLSTLKVRQNGKIIG